jgi:hypothetical protein
MLMEWPFREQTTLVYLGMFLTLKKECLIIQRKLMLNLKINLASLLCSVEMVWQKISLWASSSIC